MKTSKIIFHLDLDAFFAACEMAENPQYQSVPIVVAKNDVYKKSIILSPNYLARSYGIKTTMLTSEAIKLCPNVQIVEPNMHIYTNYSEKVFSYLSNINKKIEVASIDEAYMDVSDICQGTETIDFAKRIQNEIMNIFKLSISIGIAPNKFLAKMASDMDKPFGITVLRKRELSTKLWPISISKMNGVGKKTFPKLEAINIKTIGDLANFKDMDLLKKNVGSSHALSLYEKANGIDESEVEYENYDKALSISNSHTFENNIFDTTYLKKALKYLVNSIVYKMSQKGLKTQTVGLQIKFSDFRIISRSRALDYPTDDEYIIFKMLELILEDNLPDYFEVRLMGVFASRLVESNISKNQFDLFSNRELIDSKSKVHELVNDIKSRCGEDSIGIGIKKSDLER
ncbi:MAG: DNA polymerase IV [Bacilli bacterium]|nr:DNA polymerase IV [Bacilli bacterium]